MGWIKEHWHLVTAAATLVALGAKAYAWQVNQDTTREWDKARIEEMAKVQWQQQANIDEIVGIKARQEMIYTEQREQTKLMNQILLRLK